MRTENCREKNCETMPAPACAVILAPACVVMPAPACVVMPAPACVVMPAPACVVMPAPACVVMPQGVVNAGTKLELNPFGTSSIHALVFGGLRSVRNTQLRSLLPPFSPTLVWRATLSRGLALVLRRVLGGSERRPLRPREPQPNLQVLDDHHVVIRTHRTLCR